MKTCKILLPSLAKVSDPTTPQYPSVEVDSNYLSLPAQGSQSLLLECANDGLVRLIHCTRGGSLP